MKVGKSTSETRHNKTLSYALQTIKQSPVSPYVSRLLVYGSFARKQHKWDSDVDLFLELSEDIPFNEFRDELIRLKSRVSPPDLTLPEADLKIVVGNRWRQSEMLYYQNVKKDGINIWDI